MNDKKPSPHFWLGNAIMALALLMLLLMGKLWQLMGSGAMVLWGLTVALGLYLLLQDKGKQPPDFPG